MSLELIVFCVLVFVMVVETVLSYFTYKHFRKDFENKIQALSERIRGLDRDINGDRYKLSLIEVTGNLYKCHYNNEKQIMLILKHLGLEKYIKGAQPEKIILRKKKK